MNFDLAATPSVRRHKTDDVLNPSLPPFTKGRGMVPPFEKGVRGIFLFSAENTASATYVTEFMP
jgi:hypothetical protein